MESDNPEGGIAPAPRKNLPLRILRAIDNALHLSGLPRCLRSTFAEIARYVPQAQPFATVFAHKDKIAQRIGAAESTVYRHLAALNDAGLIERLEQERKSRNGRYSVARVRLTQKGAALLGLSVDNLASPSPVLQAGHTLTEPTVSKDQPPVGPGTVPGDLAILATKGVSRAGIFALMGKASKHGKRLADIVAAKGEALQAMRAGRLFAYLAALATGPTCFAAAAAEIRQRGRVARYANRRYAGPGGLIVRTFEHMAEVLRDGVWIETVPARFMDHVYRDIERGKLVEMRT
jgi:DNA-binding transcriptional ArsR family regulator